MNFSRLLVQRSVNVMAVRGYKNKYHREVTMNDYPVPNMDHYELEANRNRGYNAMLFGGIAVFLGAFMFARESGLINLHYSPPKSID